MQGRVSAGFRRLVVKGGVKSAGIDSSPVVARISTHAVSAPDGRSEDERDFEQRYAEYRPKVRALLHRDFPWLDSDAREELYQQGWLVVLEASRRGKPVDNELSYIFATARNAAGKLAWGPDARTRTTFDPLEGRLVDVTASGADPGEVIALIDEAAIGRSLIERLGPRQREVAVRRIGRGDTPAEICAELGITPRRYQKTMDKISASLGALVADYHAGKLTASDERLLARCVLGEADEKERELASHLVETAQGLALLCNVRHALRKAAMAAPLPTVGAAQTRDRLTLVFDHAKNAVGSVLGRGTASTGDAATNATASGSASVGGRIVGGIAACAVGAVGVGGGAACLIAGVPPTVMVDKLTGADRPAATTPQAEREPLAKTVASPAPAEPSPSPEKTATTEAPPAAPVPVPEPVPEPAVAAKREFGIERQDQPASPAQTPSTGRDEFSPTPPATSPGGGSSSTGGGSGEFGFEGG